EPIEEADTVVDEEPTEDVDTVVEAEETTEDVDAVVDDEESTEDVDTVVDDEEQIEQIDTVVAEEPTEDVDTVVEAEETTEQADTVVDEEQTEEVDTIEEENTVTENLDTEEDYIMTEQQDDIESVIVRHNSELADELLAKITALSPESFEMLVIDLLSKMGYFAFRSARYTTDDSDLIHGVILDNKTGANIYIQARKLSPDKTVGRADIQDFIDELSDKGGTGIFATTAAFSENARILADDERIMLIDGEKLASLMMTHDFCVNTEKVYEVKALDSEAFQAYEQ
ncbi:MAG: restriction endonuclease, partial [Synergistaceae bacterium]|nr:restriction endonuclease [Synergistaceae bacterium]